jgi:hypothetical protein
MLLLCLLLAGAVSIAALMLPPSFPQFRLAEARSVPYELVLDRGRARARSRASPISLQRLRN